MTAEAIREAVLTQARKMGWTVHALLSEKYRDGDLPANARDVAHVVVDAAFANHGSLTVDELLSALGRIVWDDFLADFIERCAESDEVPVLENAFTEGGVKTFVLPLYGVRMPVLVAWSTLFSNPGTVIQKMRDEHLRQFGRVFRMGPEARKEAAGYVRHFAEGKTNREIADLALKREGFDLRAVDEAEYRRELRKRTEKVRQFRKRFARYVTEIDEFQSRDSG